MVAEGSSPCFRLLFLAAVVVGIAVLVGGVFLNTSTTNRPTTSTITGANSDTTTSAEGSFPATVRPLCVGIDVGGTTSGVSFFRSFVEEEESSGASKRPANAHHVIADPLTNARLTPSTLFLNQTTDTFQVKAAVVGKEAEMEGGVFPLKAYLANPRNPPELSGLDFEIREYLGQHELVASHLNRLWVQQPLKAQKFYELLFAQQKERAEKAFGAPIQKAVISLPNWLWTADFRPVVREAALKAGLDAVRITSDAWAAGRAYGLDRVGDERFVLVVDFGGSSLEVTLISVEEGFFGFMASRAVTSGPFLHGEMERSLLKKVASEFGDRLADLTPTLRRAERAREIALDSRPRGDQQALTLEAQWVREIGKTIIALSNSSRATFLGEAIPRDWLDGVMNEKFRRPIEDTVSRVLKDSRVSPSDLADVILVGGRSNIPWVSSLMTELTGRAPRLEIPPEEVVLRGLADLCGTITGEKHVPDSELL